MARNETSERRTSLPPPFARNPLAFVTAVPAVKAAAQPNAVAMVQPSADTLDPAAECPVCYDKFASRSRFRFHLGKLFARV